MDRQTEEILARLERLAKDLDTQQYPGEAWPGTASPSPRRRVWRVAGLVAAAAVIVVVFVHVFSTRPTREESTTASQKVVISKPASTAEFPPEEVAVPAILVMEDHDSYSFIDMMADVPLVSFAKKDTFMPEYVMPLLPDTTQHLPIGKER